MAQVVSIFLQFLLLGGIGFGGPAAHIGYFRRQFVEKEHWLDDEAFGRLVALSQFLPGPGSSQVSFALGYRRAGLAGAIAAFVGFALPSFLLLYGLARVPEVWLAQPWLQALIHGLKLLAVIVVADALWGMSKSFCKDTLHWRIALWSAAALLLTEGMIMQLITLLLAGAFAAFCCRQPHFSTPQPTEVSLHLPALALFVFALVIAQWPVQNVLHQLYADFFHVGTLVFGGGHVVLPLLQHSVGEDLMPERFITGYAAAQAIPGPMFTLASFLGAEIASEQPFAGALIATGAVFLPGFLLVLIVHSSWERLTEQPRVAAAAAGVNAAVVGLLFSALYQPIFVTAVQSSLDLALVVIGFYLLKTQRWPILALIGAMLSMSLLVHVLS